MSNVTPKFLAYSDGRITDPSSRATGGNRKVGLNWDPIISSSVLLPFNFNLFYEIQKEISSKQALMRETTDKQQERRIERKITNLRKNETPFYFDVICHPAEK